LHFIKVENLVSSAALIFPAVTHKYVGCTERNECSGLGST